MSISIRAVLLDEFQSCLEFLRQRESYCVSLCSYLYKDFKPAFPLSKVGTLFMLSEKNFESENILGVFFVTASGILFHCFDDSFILENSKNEISSILIASRVRCILGRTKESIFLESLCIKKTRFTVDYQLLCFPHSKRREPLENTEQKEIPISEQTLASKVQIIEVPKDGAELLLELQEGYEKEEVIPPGDLFSREVCLENLEKSLQTHIIFALASKNQLIAKVGTNARGLQWDQIGGVYTLPSYRGRGCASVLMNHICQKLHYEKRNIALFVKNSNICAQKIYRKIGFSYETDFRIAYF